MLKIYLNTEDSHGKRYSILRDDFLYKMETGANDHFKFEKCGKVGSSFVSSGKLVRKPSKKFVIIIQNQINAL